MPLRSAFSYSIEMELIFEVRDAEEGGYYARAVGYSIFTQAENWDELKGNVLEATSLYFADMDIQPRMVSIPTTLA